MDAETRAQIARIELTTTATDVAIRGSADGSRPGLVADVRALQEAYRARGAEHESFRGRVWGAFLSLASIGLGYALTHAGAR